jgi:hypothetical protein
MPSTLIVATLVVFAIDLNIGGHLAQRAARKVISEAAQDGLGDALRDKALDVTLDAVADHGDFESADRANDIQDYIQMGATASDGIETAMRAADVASRLDNVADVANAAKKLGKLKKLKR